MTSLVLNTLMILSPLVHGAIIDGGARMTAEDLAAQQAGCTLKSPELQLAQSCYSGHMDVASAVKFVGTVGDEGKLRYCFNALVVPIKSGVQSKVQVLRDNESGQVRVQNFTVPPGPPVTVPGGKSMVLAGIEGKCITVSKGDQTCGGNQGLAVAYSGSPGAAVSIDTVSPAGDASKAPRVTSDNGNQDAKEISKILVADIDRRLEIATAAVGSESQSALNRGKPSDYLKKKESAVTECAAAANAYRAKVGLVKSDAEADAQRRQLNEMVKRIDPGQTPTKATPAGAGAGSSR